MNPSGFLPSAGESEAGLATCYFEFPVGAAGAVGTLVRNKGIATITRSSAGVYVLTLKEACVAIIDWSFDIITATPTAGGAWPRITARTTSAITLTVMNAAGAAATDPNNGDTIIGSLVCKCSSV